MEENLRLLCLESELGEFSLIPIENGKKCLMNFTVKSLHDGHLGDRKNN